MILIRMRSEALRFAASPQRGSGRASSWLSRSTVQWALAFILLAASCSPPMDDPVATFVREKMQPGSAAFVIPSPVHRGESVEAVLRISGPTLSPDELQAELKRMAGRPGIGASGSIRLASRMTAALSTDRDAIIAPKDPADQAIDLSQGTTWRWTVTPGSSGAMRVTVTLSAPVTVDGHEASYRVRSFEKTVTVTVTTADRVNDVLAWAKDYWVILAAVVTGLAGLFEWLRRKGKRKRQAGYRP